MTDVEARDGRPATVPAEAAPMPKAAVVPAPEAVLAGEDSCGRALAAARKGRGLSQGDVAGQLRLQLRQVKAIEAEDFAALPEGPFVRGFVRNYARLVGLPAEPLLAMLDARLPPTAPLRGEVATAASPVHLARREHLSRLAVIGGAVAALLLFAVLGWWTMRPGGEVAAPPASPREAPAAPAAVAASEPAAPAVATADAANAPAPAATDPEPAAAVSATALRLRFRDRSWVEIRQEADGAVLMSQNNEPGTQVTVDGTPPYLLVIGDASSVDLEFRGRPVDLAGGASRGDVARLRLE
jgi:cytoskeleton protein RodZ